MMSDIDPSPRSQGRGSGFARSMASSGVRGGLLIGLAIVIGLVLLQVIDNADDASSDETGVTVDTEPTETTTPTETTQPTVTTLPAETRPPNEIRVLVLNGADPEAPLAGTTTDALQSAGYQMVPPNNTTQRTGTVVLCEEDFTGDAPALAAAVGETAVVEPFPETPPENAENVDQYDCLVVLGS